MLYEFVALDFRTYVLFPLALFCVLVYELINGFHDTANAVTTVIYTRSMRAETAVIISGIFNFCGVMLGGLSVAYSIMELFPIDLLIGNNETKNLISIIFSVLFSSILWNIGTWYLGLPSSSSHTLIGSIVGAVISNSFIAGQLMLSILNIKKISGVLLSLFFSPIIGILISGILMFYLRKFWSHAVNLRKIHLTPIEREKQDGKKNPPFLVRAILILSSAGVSFSHGSNDGQKGIGLIMLILIGMIPSKFSLNMNANCYDISKVYNAVLSLNKYYENHQLEIDLATKKLCTLKNLQNKCFSKKQSSIKETIHNALYTLKDIQTYSVLNPQQRSQIRKSLTCLSNITSNITKISGIKREDIIFLNDLKKNLLHTVEYAPLWTIVMIAITLSLGTMIGWKRSVITIGEKIGKKGMTYAQGVSAQITTAFSVGIASYFGIPVSTTQVLSSAVAGSMIADKNEIQRKTVRNIFLTWMFTIPVSVFLSSLFYVSLSKLI
ncbi:inorganic phosphate transporter [Candidatus Riesia pediculicola]|uniref:Phosphate transporter n=1 Tax=Riesia pediculicola (strain USDA) TaxID=515618 RepID=D4G8V6_RIEPU|nr:inorganic phosphate transporter [Candidatus Riesia pediculicola]ADD79708.1 probable low-affinity inorganic phosphate transporter 2 [Candidatus Riesia pediculicola USDA]ARC53968.1 phosphate transporter PitA [Candidatus Riesia pediculicola]QOJ86595.1 inorganic phosphate transporter [Candidatus Riesia pediculicola]